jgi:hypothetical protein
MAKRNNSGKRTSPAAAPPATATATASDAAAATDAMEQRVVAFAEQLGRIAGTVQAKTEGWMDRETLNKQIAGVRDSAAELLEQLKTNVMKATGSGTVEKTTTAPAAPTSKGRSGGVVDAPGKKHRKPTPDDPRAMAADAKASNIRSSKASMKTMKRRGRG